MVDIVEHNVLESSSGKTLQLYAPASILRCFPLQHEDLASVEKLVAVAQQTDYHPNRAKNFRACACACHAPCRFKNWPTTRAHLI